jgi:hypothetical protein
MYYPGKHRQSSINPEVPHSLEGVLNSLETLLEHRNHEVPDFVQEAMQSFASNIAEQHDILMVPVVNALDTLEPTPVNIPVLKDIVRHGDPLATSAETETDINTDLDVLLDTLRAELDSLVDDIIGDARGRFTEVLENASAKNSISLKDNLNDFMRGALARHSHNK